MSDLPASHRRPRWARRLGLVAALLVVVGLTALFLRPDAPGGGGVDGDRAPAASGGVGDPPATPAEITSCDDPPTTFALLCEAHATVTERYVAPLDDADLARGATRGIDAELDERRPLAGSDRREVGACAVPSDDFTRFCDSFARAVADYGLAPDRAVEIAVDGMLLHGIGDPNTAYLDPTRYELFREDVTGEVEGIGALVQIQHRDDGEPDCQVLSDRCILVVVTPIPGGPAAAEGIRAGDRIVAFDDEEVAGETLDEAVSRGRGPAGSEVVVAVERDGETLEFVVTRESFSVPNVAHELLEGGVGYVRIFQFTDAAEDEVDAALRDLIARGADAFIIDLRSNPGGHTVPVRNIAGYFLEADELVFVMESSGGEREDWRAPDSGLEQTRRAPLAVLTDRGTASAAEIMAGALREHGRATLLGETTFGKGTAQGLFELDTGGALRVTVARWYTPRGATVDGDGVVPDVTVESPEDIAITEEGASEDDPVISRALEILRGG